MFPSIALWLPRLLMGYLLRAMFRRFDAYANGIEQAVKEAIQDYETLI